MAAEKGLNIVFGESDGSVGQPMRETLRDAGFGGFRSVTVPDAMTGAVTEKLADLVIADIRFLGTPPGRFVRDIRAGKVGINPYVPIIAMIFEHEVGTLRGLVDSGVDDVVVKPAAPATVLMKVRALVERRKPFVVTAEYIGPDRRKSNRTDDANPIPLFDVPNTLRDKFMGNQIDEVELRSHSSDPR